MPAISSGGCAAGSAVVPGSARKSALRVKAGVTRPPSTAIMAQTPSSPPRRPCGSVEARPIQSRCTSRLASQISVSSSRNIMFCGFGRRSSWLSTLAPSTGRKARSITATSGAGSAPENHTAMRPASHSPETMAMKRAGADFAPVQFGTAVRKKPPSAAVAKPKTISCACHRCGAGAKGMASIMPPAAWTPSQSSQTSMAKTP